MRHARLKIAILTTYVIFAVLLNSVGTLILQSIETFRVTKASAGTLEGFKDLSIAISSFLLAAQLPRFGLRRAMIIGLLLVAAACLAMPLLPSFTTTRLLFLITGISFALVKVGVYSFVGLLTKTDREHASLLNLIEGVFMLGVLSGYWLFSAFINEEMPGDPAWLQTFYVLAALALAAALLLGSCSFDESAARSEAASQSPAQQFLAMLALVAMPLTIAFVVSIFLYVLVEQGVGSWLPTFNRERLGLSAPMSVQAASIFAVGLAVGRLGAGLVGRRTGLFTLLTVCLIAMGVLIVLALPLAGPKGATISTWAQAPLVAFLLPLIGVFMGPIYPALNSAVLSALPKHAHPAMVGLIVVFSALGGTTGSLIVGRTFDAFGGAIAFYVLLVPICLTLIAVFVLRYRIRLGQHPTGHLREV